MLISWSEKKIVFHMIHCLQECDLFSLDAEDADDRFAAAYCYHAR